MTGPDDPTRHPVRPSTTHPPMRPSTQMVYHWGGGPAFVHPVQPYPRQGGGTVPMARHRKGNPGPTWMERSSARRAGSHRAWNGTPRLGPKEESMLLRGAEEASASREAKRCSTCRGPRDRPGRNCLGCHAAYMRAWRPLHPMTAEQRRRANARSYLKTYVRRGKVRREPCAVCGAGKAEGHHEDYGKPLEVRWLCRAHHLEHHHG